MINSFSADWLRLSWDDFIALSSTPGSAGWNSEQVSSFLRRPALPRVTLDVSSDGRRMVSTCEIVHRGHLLKNAPPYLHGADLGVLIKWFVFSGDGSLKEAFSSYLVISADGMVRTSILLPCDAPPDIERKSQAVAVQYFAVFFSVQALLLRGGASTDRRKSRAPAGRILLSSGERVTLPAKIHLLSLQLGGRSMSQAVDHAVRSFAPRFRRCAAWKVRGFFRHLKSGAVVYVRPHVRGPDRWSVKPADRELVF